MLSLNRKDNCLKKIALSPKRKGCRCEAIGLSVWGEGRCRVGEGASEAEEEADGEVAWAEEIGFAEGGWTVVKGVGVSAAVEEVSGGNVYFPATFQAAR